MATVLTAGQASAATVGSQYAPKVYVFGGASYSGHETATPATTLTITQSGYYKLTGASPAARVVVQSGVSADVTIENLSIDISGASGVANASPFKINSGASVTLRLAGENYLRAVDTSAAIEAPAGATVVITSAAGDGALAGSLDAVSQYGAAIGGGSDQAGGSITINGGTIHATGSYAVGASDGGGGAGIGGGLKGDGGTIVINGGGGADWGAACIGGGGGDNSNETNDAGEAGNITITGGFVKADAPDWSAGIGSGYTPKNYNIHGQITISGGVVTASSTQGGAGIGGGMQSNSGVITISGGFVDAYAFGGVGDPAGRSSGWTAQTSERAGDGARRTTIR
jgi:hypothetical protein